MPLPFNADDTRVHVDSRRLRLVRQTAIVLSLGVYIGYLWYRGAYSLNPDAPIFAALVYLAEVHGGLSLFFYYFQLWAPRRRVVPELFTPNPFTVDVFVTTFNEDEALLRQTLRAALDMRYPHRTWVLDDGRRESVRLLAEELGCGYITRATNEHAKAGNWNNAFRQTSADLIVTFDADHVPQPSFIERTIGFFQDPKVFLVQVPQQYHNLDSVQHHVNWDERRMYGEQDVFFDLVMPGKDHWNAAFFCGTGAVLRRAALEPHGGIITGSITEDMHTSVVLHAEGWKSVYLNETLVTGLAPTDVKTFLKQRLRWAEGNLKIVHDINPLTCRGLTIAQRISYLSSIFHWTIGLPKLVFYLAPPWMLFSGTFPIAPFDRAIVTVYLVNMACLIGTYKLLSRGRGRLLMDEFFNMLNTFTLLQALARLITDGRRMGTFVVTDKKGSGAAGFEVLPHYVLLGFSLLALNWSMLGLGFGVTDDLTGASIGVFWTLYNMAFVVGVLRLAARPAQKRDSTRFRMSVPVSGRCTGRQQIGLTADLSEGGCALLWPEPLPEHGRQAFDLHLPGRTVHVTGTVTRRPQTARGWYPHGVAFVDVPVATVDAINDAIFDSVVPELLTSLRRPSWPARVGLQLRSRLRRQLLRRSVRQQVRLPVRLATHTASWMVTTRDVSASGVSVVCPAAIPLGTRLAVDMLAPGAMWSRAGVVARCRPIQVRGRSAGAWDIGVRYAGEPLELPQHTSGQAEVA